MDSAAGQIDILWGAVAGALIVVAGGFYALFFALARLQHSRTFNLLSVICYFALAIATVMLARTLQLDGFWIFVAAVMLLGYFFAPRAIWWLCVGTHEDAAADESVSPRPIGAAK